MRSAAPQFVCLLSHPSDLLLVSGLPQQTVRKAAMYSSMENSSGVPIVGFLQFVTICFMTIIVVSTNVFLSLPV